MNHSSAFPTADPQKLSATVQYWNQVAANFDNAPDHGLHDPLIRLAWRDLLLPWLPPKPANLLDIGCGTGSLTVLLAELGYSLSGLDVSPAMIAQAEAKAQQAGQHVAFHIMDAAQPSLPPHQFDLILCRHLLWALPAPDQVLQRWATLLAPGGRLLLIEGFWHTGGGLRVQAVLAALPSTLVKVMVQSLSQQSILWGGVVTDERYLVVADQVVAEG